MGMINFCLLVYLFVLSQVIASCIAVPSSASGMEQDSLRILNNDTHLQEIISFLALGQEKVLP